MAFAALSTRRNRRAIWNHYGSLEADAAFSIHSNLLANVTFAALSTHWNLLASWNQYMVRFKAMAKA